MKKLFIGYALSGREKIAVDALREKIAQAFGVQAALSIPPHITLFAPFETDGEQRLAKRMARIAESQTAFAFPVVSFSPFGNKVWFLDPVQDPGLLSLKEQLTAAVKESLNIDERGGFRLPHFHITLAYRDVSPDAHRLIGEFLRDQPLPIDSVTVDSVTLFERTPDEKGWMAAETFRFHA